MTVSGKVHQITHVIMKKIMTILIIGSIAHTGAYFERGTAPTLLDDVACTGTESRLMNCRYDSNTSDCTHSEDAGVTCRIISC